MAPDRSVELPGPGGRWPLYALPRYAPDPLAFVTSAAREYGDVVSYRLGPARVIQINHPDEIERVLVRGGAKLHKDQFTAKMSALVGHGLLTSEGATWRRHRKLAAPLLQRKHIADYGAAMVALSEAWLADAMARTGAGAPGHEPDKAVVDIHHEMSQLTMAIVTRTLFDAEVSEAAGGVGEQVEIVTREFMRIYETWRAVLPEWLPTPARRRMNRGVAYVDRIIYDLIAERRANGAGSAGSAGGRGDLLSRLMAAVDTEGEPLSDQQLRDEAVTMFLAGHETTALALTYAWHALADRPELTARLHAELDALLGAGDAARAPTMADMTSLPFTTAVVKETMRLFPPAWAIGREVIGGEGAWQIGGRELAIGTQIFICPWVVHRDERWFADAGTFRPERWLDGSTDNLPRFAYFPFGGGARVCIGNHFAMAEAVLAMATIGRRLRFERADDRPLGLHPAITLRPTGPVRLRAIPR